MSSEPPKLLVLANSFVVGATKSFTRILSKYGNTLVLGRIPVAANLIIRDRMNGTISVRVKKGPDFCVRSKV